MGHKTNLWLHRWVARPICGCIDGLQDQLTQEMGIETNQAQIILVSKKANTACCFVGNKNHIQTKRLTIITILKPSLHKQLTFYPIYGRT